MSFPGAATVFLGALVELTELALVALALKGTPVRWKIIGLLVGVIALGILAGTSMLVEVATSRSVVTLALDLLLLTIGVRILYASMKQAAEDLGNSEESSLPFRSVVYVTSEAILMEGGEIAILIATVTERTRTVAGPILGLILAFIVVGALSCLVGRLALIKSQNRLRLLSGSVLCGLGATRALERMGLGIGGWLFPLAVMAIMLVVGVTLQSVVQQHCDIQKGSFDALVE